MQAEACANTDALVLTRQGLATELAGIPVVTQEDEIAAYCRDWHGDLQTSAVAVLRPANTPEVVRCVQACAARGLAVVAQGGNTGLVMGAVPDDAASQVVLSLERMNQIRCIDVEDFSAVVDAGCVLETVKHAVAEHELFFPLSLGAQGSCQIGGNVSTNAGGINVLRYGMARDLVLGLEVVLPDGSVLDLLQTLRKDNRGIDLKQLFIGAEGTLGIVTGVAIKLFPQPQQSETALIAMDSLQDVIELYRLARHQCCDLMSAFEFMQPLAFQLAIEAQPQLSMPLGDYPAYVLMEVSGSKLIDVRCMLETFLEQAMADGLVKDGVVAATQTQSMGLWRFREAMVEGQARRGVHLRTDVSVPLSSLAQFVEEAQHSLQKTFPQCEVVAYGHVGDGNVHMNVLPPSSATLKERLKILHEGTDVINAWVDHYKGSISAEHGIGRLKRDDFERRLPDAQRRILQGLRDLIDPQRIMNPCCQLGAPPRRP